MEGLKHKQVDRYTCILPAYLFTCLLSYLSTYHFKGMRQYFKAYLAEICSGTTKDLSIGVDVKRAVCRKRELFAGAHANLLEAAMGTLHRFRNNAEHRGAAHVRDHRIMK